LNVDSYQENSKALLKNILLSYSSMNLFETNGKVMTETYVYSSLPSQFIKRLLWTKHIKKTEFSIAYHKPSKFTLKWKICGLEEVTNYNPFPYFYEKDLCKNSKISGSFEFENDKSNMLLNNEKYVFDNYNLQNNPFAAFYRMETLSAAEYSVPLLLLNNGEILEKYNNLSEFENIRSELVNNVDCVVLKGVSFKGENMNGIFITFWIGKEDHRIKKVETENIVDEGKIVITEFYDLLPSND
jgi:hypothetical protein